MLEKRLQTSIINHLNSNGCYVWNVNAGKMRYSYKGRQGVVNLAPTGHSDIQGIHKATGTFIAIEVKVPERRKNVSIPQQVFLDRVKGYGGVSGVATSEDEALQIVESFFS